MEKASSTNTQLPPLLLPPTPHHTAQSILTTSIPLAMDVSSISDPLSPLSSHPLPPFPTNIPSAPLLRISLLKLLSHDALESHRLFTACKDLGFFYLDLRSTTPGDSLLADANALFDVNEQFFNLPLDEKMKYDFSNQKSYFGYKGYGTAVIDKKGTLDRNEFYNVPSPQIPPSPKPPFTYAN